MSRRRPTLPPGRPGSTIGAGGLHFRVRDGTGCFPSAIATKTRCPLTDVGEGAALERSSRTTIASASKEKESSPRAISTGQLHTLPCFHFPPIDLVVFQEPMFIKNGKPDLAEGFTLRCLQRLSRPYVGYPAMLLAEQLAHQRYVPPNPLVLGRKPRKFPAPTADRDRPVSRRSKPSSRTAFIGEQPNPWELLHPQDVMSRHRFDSTLSCGTDYIFILPPRLGDKHRA